MSDAPVLYERRGPIGLITLNRPDNRNSMTPDLLDGFREVVHAVAQEVRADHDLRCVVLTGRGRCFSAGADFKSQIQREGGGGRTLLPHERSYAMYEPFLTVLEIEVPVVAALNGHTVGGGFGLALLCDLRVANAGAKHGVNFARIGLHPGLGIGYLLPRIVGPVKAAELLLCGTLFDGDEALAMGLVNRSVPADQVLPTAMELAESVAAGSPIAVRMMKRSFYDALGWDIRAAAHAEAYAQAITVDTEDFREGMAALLAKRAPVFKGR